MTKNLNGRPKDNQRKRVYRAEDKAFYFGFRPERFKDENQVRSFITSVILNESVLKEYGNIGFVDIKLTNAPLKFARHSLRGKHVHMLRLPRWAWNKITILHEMAHGYTLNKYGIFNVQAHGPEFCTIYLNLIKIMMGEGWTRILANSFINHKVKYHGIEWR